jgi:hypothetical protein
MAQKLEQGYQPAQIRDSLLVNLIWILLTEKYNLACNRRASTNTTTGAKFCEAAKSEGRIEQPNECPWTQTALHREFSPTRWHPCTIHHWLKDQRRWRPFLNMLVHVGSYSTSALIQIDLCGRNLQIDYCRLSMFGNFLHIQLHMNF